MNSNPRTWALAAVVVAYLALVGILAASIWDDHEPTHPVVASAR